MDQSLSYSAKAYYFQKNGFEIRIGKTGDEILIEAEILENSQLYSTILTEIDLKNFNNPLFTTLESFRKGLVEGFSGQYTHVSATIDHNAQIKLNSNFKVANKDRTVVNEIQLTAKNLELLDSCERTIMKLNEQNNISQEYKDKHCLKLFERFLENQRILQARLDEVAENRPLGENEGGNKENLKELKKLIEESVNKMNERINKLEELVVEKINNVAELQKNYEGLQEELNRKPDNGMEKISEELKGLARKQKELEDTCIQVNEIATTVEIVEDKLMKIAEAGDATAEEFNKRIEKIQEEIESKFERQTKGEDNASQGQIHIIKRSVEELAETVRNGQESLENDIHNKFQHVSNDVDNRLEMIKETFVKPMKIFEQEIKNISKLDHRVNELEAVCFKVEDRVRELEKKPQHVEPLSGLHKDNPKALEKIQAEFKPNFYDGDLHFTNNNRNVESPGGIIIDRTLLGKNPLPKSGKFSVSFKFGNIARGKEGVLAFGVAVGSLKETLCIMAPGCFFINPFDKCAYVNADYRTFGSTDLIPEDVICVIVDREGDQVEFEVNGKMVIKCKLDAESFGDEELFPCVHVQQCKDIKLSFI